MSKKAIWTDRRRPFFGLPLSFVQYQLFPDRLYIISGFLTRRQEELRLYRISDVSLRQGLFQRLFSVGSIRLVTNDASHPKLFIHDVRDPEHLMHILSDMAETERERVRVMFVEPMS